MSRDIDDLIEGLKILAPYFDPETTGCLGIDKSTSSVVVAMTDQPIISDDVERLIGLNWYQIEVLETLDEMSVQDYIRHGAWYFDV